MPPALERSPPAALERSPPAALQMPPPAWGDATPALEVPPPLEMPPPALEMSPPALGTMSPGHGDVTITGDATTSPRGAASTRPGDATTGMGRCHHHWRCHHQPWGRCHQDTEMSPSLQMPPPEWGAALSSPPRPYPSHIIVLSMRGCPDPHSLLGPPQPTRGQRCPHPCPHPLMLC